jgi:alpha,alpha-trehalose-phosphate synthase [UDP-forming]
VGSERGASDSRARVVVVANRLPVVRTPRGWRSASGGLVAALRPVLEASGGGWVGWSGSRETPPGHIGGLSLELVSVPLSPRLVADYYHGFSNQTMWPLLHDLVHQPVIEPLWWRAYKRANEAFAAAAQEGRRRFGDDPKVFWVHDYHLMLVPDLIRRTNVDSRILYFLHTPFPAPELFARLPGRSALLRGLLGSDAVAFHTDLYRENFLRACRSLVPEARVAGDTVHLPDGRSVRSAVHPISVDAAALATMVAHPQIQRQTKRLREQLGPRTVMLGVDRLDYTKGILQRLRALELLLERRPDLRGGITLVQIAEPSRDEEPRYREIRAEVEQAVGRVNGRFTEPGRAVPVRYMYRTMPLRRLLSYYAVADVAVVTPLKDGMNLVAKEYVICQAATNGDGVLILSEFAGASRELTQAIPCNPFDEEGLSKVMEDALSMPDHDRRDRLRSMANHIASHDVFAWARAALAEKPDPDDTGRRALRTWPSAAMHS